MSLIHDLDWRYATKRYNDKKIIKSEDLMIIQKAIQLAPSSYGLQLFKVLNINNLDIRKQLKIASWNQPQITEASKLMVFCVPTNHLEEYIDRFFELKQSIQGLDTKGLDDYKQFIKTSIKEKSAEDIYNWLCKQTYIALTNALIACASLKIDSTPIEGFDQKQYNQILNLEEKHLSASIVLAIGYRNKEDSTQHLKKVRRPIEDLFEDI